MQILSSYTPAFLKDVGIFALPAFLVIVGAGVFWVVARRESIAESQSKEMPRETAGVSDAVNHQHQAIIRMIQEFLGTARDYGSRLIHINDRLSRPLQNEDLHEIVGLLIEDNKALAQSTSDLERRLQEAQRTIEQLTSNLHQAKEISDRDPLTSLYNQRHFNAALQKQLKVADSVKRPLSLLLLDVDNFKQINDTHGHLVGDEVLKTLGSVIEAAIRGGDIAARYGGDEFAIILPNASVANAKMVAERVLSLLRMKKWKVDNRDIPMEVTISIGAAAVAPHDSPKKLFERADASLYKSKAAGKNRVSLDNRKSAAPAEMAPR